MSEQPTDVVPLKIAQLARNLCEVPEWTDEFSRATAWEALLIALYIEICRVSGDIPADHLLERARTRVTSILDHTMAEFLERGDDTAARRCQDARADVEYVWSRLKIIAVNSDGLPKRVRSERVVAWLGRMWRAFRGSG